MSNGNGHLVDQIRTAWGAKASSATAARHILVGLFFHTRDEQRRIDMQGRVLKVSDGMALVQLYSFLDGEPGVKKVVPIDSMREWDFYQTADEWRIAYCRAEGMSPREIEDSERFHKTLQAMANGTFDPKEHLA